MFPHIESLFVEEKFSCIWGIRHEWARRSVVEFANYDGAWNRRLSERHQVRAWGQKVNSYNSPVRNRCLIINVSKHIVTVRFVVLLHSHRDHNAPPDSSKTRRKSIYNFFLRHQDAVDDHMTSPSVHKKVMKPSETVLSMKPSEAPTSPPQKPSKRATSFIKKKPRLERGLSDQSVLRLNRNVNLGNEN